MEIKKLKPNSPTIPKTKKSRSKKGEGKHRTTEPYYPQVIENITMTYRPHNCICTWAAHANGTQYLKYRHTQCPAKRKGDHR